jgi:hypothetical protein
MAGSRAMTVTLTTMEGASGRRLMKGGPRRNGFVEPITRTLLMEGAVDGSRLIALRMEGSVD